MNNLALLFLLGLVSFYIPKCLSQNNDKQCFSQSLKPSYPCCTGNKVVYTDKDGDWGVENDKWCGIGNSHSNSSDYFCFSILLGYNCCKECKVLYTDENGDWGIENNKWCGIKNSCASSIENVVQKGIMEESVLNTTNISIDDLNDFDFLFLKLENNKENMIYSPLSIKHGLKMLEEGADKNTFDELNKLTGKIKLPIYVDQESHDLPYYGNFSLNNKLYVSDMSYNITEEYPNLLKKRYNATIQNYLFPNYETWLDPDNLSNTVILLTNPFTENAVQKKDIDYLNINNDISFYKQFVYPFNDVEIYSFYREDGIRTTMNGMIKNKVSDENIAYYKDNNINVFCMDLQPCAGIQLEFMAIMPENENLSDFINNISKKKINEIDSKLKFSSDEQCNLMILLPRFRFKYSLDLKKNLMKLGIKDAFNKMTADFSKMNSKNKLYVSDALHKQLIDFSRRGLKMDSDVSSPVDDVDINHPTVSIEMTKPFMFIIRDKISKEIWYIGTVHEPLAPYIDNMFNMTHVNPFIN